VRPPAAGIASDLKQGCGTGLEEQVIDHALVLEREWSEFTRQREDEVHIAGGQQFLFACLEPAETRVRLASGTMPVAARVIGDGRRGPQAEQRSRWPPSAAVRQRVIASRTF
jgi:hypothetical protein